MADNLAALVKQITEGVDNALRNNKLSKMIAYTSSTCYIVKLESGDVELTVDNSGYPLMVLSGLGGYVIPISKISDFENPQSQYKVSGDVIIPVEKIETVVFNW